MIEVILTLVAQPRRKGAMIETLRSLMLPLQAAPGLILCRLYHAADESNTICYIEQWQTLEDLDRQICSDHYTRLMTLMEAAAEIPELRLNGAGDVKGLEYLKAVRHVTDEK